MLQEYNNIIVIAGAGISTNAGIPDFRGENGLYLKENIEELLTIKYFKEDPYFINKFLERFKEKEYEPTFTHKYLKCLCDKNKIRRIYTQNIDGLEEKAGIPTDKLVFCHGNLKKSHCYNCGKENDNKIICECGGYIKPDVILFGEKLDETVFDKLDEDLTYQTCDLFLVIGTSLMVSPINNILDRLEKVPIIYINKQYPSKDIAYRNMMSAAKIQYIKKDCDKFFEELDFNDRLFE